MKLSKSFLPLFFTQFFGAFNDNLFKNALVIFVAFKAAAESQNGEIMVTLIAFLFILPFFLFSAIAGQVADKYDKAKLIRIIKLVEIFIMAFAGLGFYLSNLPILLCTLFLMATQSAFFGPLKYSIIPQLLEKNQILRANGLISGSTFIAILLGTIIGGLLILEKGGVLIVVVLTIICAIFGYFSSRHIKNQKTSAKFSLDFNIFRQSLQILKIARQKQEVFLSIIGISWCWFLGSTFLAQFPNYAKNILFANHQVVTLFLTMFCIGVAIGSILCNKLLKSKSSADLAPFSLLLITVFIVDLFFASKSFTPIYNNVILGSSQFILSKGSWRILLDLFLIATFTGVYVVPLYAIIQTKTDIKNRARVIAALNIYDSGFMVLSALMAIGLFSLNFNSLDIFLVTAIINALFILPISHLVDSCKVRAVALPILKLFKEKNSKKELIGMSLLVLSVIIVLFVK